jgi:hypothetical protein
VRPIGSVFRSAEAHADDHRIVYTPPVVAGSTPGRPARESDRGISEEATQGWRKLLVFSTLFEWDRVQGGSDTWTTSAPPM